MNPDMIERFMDRKEKRLYFGFKLNEFERITND
jgi:hypothetical protein